MKKIKGQQYQGPEILEKPLFMPFHVSLKPGLELPRMSVMGQWSWGASSYLGRGWGALGRDPAPSELRRTLRRSSDNLPGWFLGRVARRAFAYE